MNFNQPKAAAGVSAEPMISFPRWWIEKIRDGLMAVDKLPSGPLGDWAFLFREQLTDALDKPVAPSLDGLIAWLETKDPNGTYEWASPCEPCLIEQYWASTGMTKAELSTTDDQGLTPYFYLSTAHDCLAFSEPRTFGAALKRARAAKALATVS